MTFERTKVLPENQSVIGYTSGGLVENGLMILMQFSAGPSIGSSLVRSIVDNGDDRFVFVQYLPINRALSDTEYKAALRSVHLVIELIKPKTILSLDDDYMKYMPPNIYSIYKDRFVLANKGVASVGHPSCELIQRMAERIHEPGTPIYILRDDNVSHIESSRALGQCLRDLGHEVTHMQATTLSELRTELFSVAAKPRGILISLVSTVSDTEFNVPVGLDAINRLIIKINKKHIDIGFVRATNNLSIVIIPSLDNLRSDSRWDKIRTTPRVYVSTDRLDEVNGDLVYKNMFQDISGVLSK